MLDSLLAALDAANLQPRLVDAGPFALLRALDDPTADIEAAPGEADAVVSVGAGVTTVVVVERGVPQFVRILVTGGADLTAAVASELDVDLETAEDLKRRADPESDDEMLVRAAALVEAHVGPLIEEVRGSLDFHLAQSSQTSSIRRILVTGGGSRANDFVARLGEVMGVPAERADPLRSVRVGKTGLSDAQIDAARDVMATAVGLALAALPPPEGARRISLLPREILVARVARRQVAMAAGAVGALAALLLLLWAIRGGQVSDEQDRAADEEARAARLRSEIAQLSDVEELERLIGERRDLAAVALANDVSWPRLLQEVATVIPTDVWLTTFNGSSVTSDVSFAGQGFDHTSSARWLLRVSDLPSLTGLWLPSSVKSEAAGRSLVTFSSTGQITPAARSDRLAEIQDAG
jgi:cell division ATPase FtsA